MLMTLHKYLATLVLIVSIGNVSVALAEVDAQLVIGKVIIAKGKVNAITVDGIERKLKRKALVQQGDTISTGARSRVLMLLNDGSKFELGAEASLKLTEFVYKQSVDDDKVYAEALKGVFRFVTGKIARQRPESMKVRAGAVATIGVRGTHVLGKVEGESVTVILLEPEGDTQRKSAIDVANNAGTVLVDEPGWGTFVADANTPPTPPRRMRIQTIQNLMRTMQSIQRIPNVRPRF